LPRQQTFDRITELCAKVFDCTVSLVSLVDSERQWFLSSVGLEVRETPRDVSFCDHAIASGCTLLVSDALADERFADNALVLAKPSIRSYLGVPIKAPDGALIGTLCVADQRVESFNDKQFAMLQNMAAIVEELIAAHSQKLVTAHLDADLNESSSQLRKSNRIFQQAERVARVGSWEFEIESKGLVWSDEAFAIYGSPNPAPYSIEDTLPYYAPEDQRPVSALMMRAIKTGEPFVTEVGLHAANGQYKRAKLMGERLAADDYSPARIIGVVQDITEAYHAQLALQRAADHDTLTDLYNRNAFDRALQRKLREISRTGGSSFLLLLDLDGFKDINDTFGHLIGDVVLEEISARIKKVVPSNAVAARWGGDEFVILMPSHQTAVGAKSLGEAILANLEGQFDIGGRKVGISATCGLVEIDGTASAREIVRRADLALYHGKEREPGRVHLYVPGLEEANHFRQVAIARVREALDHDRIYAGYQPIVELATNKLVGFEALMRLSTPSGGRMTASEVLPAILDPILSREIGERMLSCLCRELPGIETVHQDLQFISLNATEADLISRDFSDRLLSSLADASINPKKIMLEVTETMLMVNDAATVQKVLADLRSAGMRIALDDFGTGFSSLSHLRDFPIDKVKIDSSFVKSICFEHQTRLIVQALISMAKNLGMEVVAEGIETKDQLDLLIQLGCTSGQGYLISPAETSCRVKAMQFRKEKLSSRALRSAA
jgi:diguanylate cyclase (GGDEF)-like protein